MAGLAENLETSQAPHPTAHCVQDSSVCEAERKVHRVMSSAGPIYQLSRTLMRLEGWGGGGGNYWLGHQWEARRRMGIISGQTKTECLGTGIIIGWRWRGEHTEQLLSVVAVSVVLRQAGLVVWGWFRSSGQGERLGASRGWGGPVSDKVRTQNVDNGQQNLLRRSISMCDFSPLLRMLQN